MTVVLAVLHSVAVFGAIGLALLIALLVVVWGCAFLEARKNGGIGV